MEAGLTGFIVVASAVVVAVLRLTFNYCRAEASRRQFERMALDSSGGLMDARMRANLKVLGSLGVSCQETAPRRDPIRDYEPEQWRQEP
jgi:hypothetical protein